MTGLEKLQKAIEEEASANAEVLINQAKQEADDIMKAAKLEADKKCAEIAIKSEADVKDVLSRAESAAELIEKKAILDAKQQIIRNVLDNARKSLNKRSDNEYMEIILRMVRKYAHNKHGEILFSAADKKRLPKGFEALVKRALAEKPGASLLISEENVETTGGFILKYGDIEENCTFDAIFNAAKEDLQDKINMKLFNN